MIYNYKDIPNSVLYAIPIQKKKPGNPGTRSKKRYKDIVCAFDIETTRLDEKHSIMYVWQFQLGMDLTIMGRSWKECLRFFKKISDSCADDEYFVIYVHNLSFEFQYLAGQYHFSNDEVFAVESRRVLKCEMYDHLEFRCSYLHSNMSLDEYLRKMGVQDLKLSGHDFDYEKLRFPWTELTADEVHYCVNDVKGLVEALYIEMHLDNDNLYSIPLTSTGYVRRDVKAAMREVGPFFRQETITQLEDIYTFERSIPRWKYTCEQILCRADSFTSTLGRSLFKLSGY